MQYLLSGVLNKTRDVQDVRLTGEDFASRCCMLSIEDERSSATKDKYDFTFHIQAKSLVLVYNGAISCHKLDSDW